MIVPNKQAQYEKYGTKQQQQTKKSSSQHETIRNCIKLQICVFKRLFVLAQTCSLQSLRVTYATMTTKDIEFI